MNTYQPQIGTPSTKLSNTYQTPSSKNATSTVQYQTFTTTAAIPQYQYVTITQQAPATGTTTVVNSSVAPIQQSGIRYSQQLVTQLASPQQQTGIIGQPLTVSSYQIQNANINSVSSPRISAAPVQVTSPANNSDLAQSIINKYKSISQSQQIIQQIQQKQQANSNGATQSQGMRQSSTPNNLNSLAQTQKPDLSSPKINYESIQTKISHPIEIAPYSPQYSSPIQAKFFQTESSTKNSAIQQQQQQQQNIFTYQPYRDTSRNASNYVPSTIQNVPENGGTLNTYKSNGNLNQSFNQLNTSKFNSISMIPDKVSDKLIDEFQKLTESNLKFFMQNKQKWKEIEESLKHENDDLKLKISMLHESYSQINKSMIGGAAGTKPDISFSIQKDLDIATTYEQKVLLIQKELERSHKELEDYRKKNQEAQKKNDELNHTCTQLNEQLNSQMEVEKKKKEDQLKTSGSRWKSSTAAQPIKNYANMIIDAKKSNEKTTKIDYAKMNKEFGQKMAQKSSLKNTSSSMSSIQRPSSNTQSSRQKENQSSNDLNKSLNGSFQQSSSKGMIERRSSKDSSQIKQNKAILTPFLKQLLEETNLVKYTDVFLSNGYSNEEQIKQINTDALNKMGIPPGFQIKIMKRINTLNLNKSVDLNNTELAKKPSMNNNNSITTPKSVAQKSLLEEQKVNIQEKKSESPSKQTDNNNNKIASRPPLLKKQPSQDLKKVRFQEKSPQIQPKIKQSTDNTGKQLFHTESTATDAQTPSDFLSKKVSCWQCYSIFVEEKAIQQHGKLFCKQECLQTYEDFYIVQCANKNCLKKISKQDCSFREGNWYCLGKCEPNIQQIEQMWEEQIQSTEKMEGETDEQYYERKIKEFENIDKRKKVEYDLKLSSENEKKSKILSLEEIEAKYKFINETQNID